MAYNNNNQNNQRVSTDRFGNAYVLKFAKESDKAEGFFKCHVELGGKLYAIEVSNHANDRDIKGQSVSGMWVKVTKKDTSKKVTSI